MDVCVNVIHVYCICAQVLQICKSMGVHRDQRRVSVDCCSVIVCLIFLSQGLSLNLELGW